MSLLNLLPTKLRKFWCMTCRKKTIHTVRDRGNQEIFRCRKCGTEVVYTVR